MATVKELEREVLELKDRLEQIERTARCMHPSWETDRENPRVWRCTGCGCEDLRRH